MSGSTANPKPPDRPTRRGRGYLLSLVGLLFATGLLSVRGVEVRIPREVVRFIQAICPPGCRFDPPPPTLEQPALESRLGVHLRDANGQVSVWAFVNPKTRTPLPTGPDGKSLNRAPGEGPPDWHPAHNAGIVIDAILYEINGTPVHSVPEAERLLAEAGPTITLKFSDPTQNGQMRTRVGVELARSTTDP